MRRMRGSLRVAVVAAVVSAVVGAGSAVLAGHQFVDVPDTHTFHDEISAMGDAGITGPFPDGTFRPSSTLTRQAMAAFLERGLGRITADDNPIVLSPGGSVTAAEVTIEAGATKTGGGYVHLTGSAHGTANSNCPCTIAATLLTPEGLNLGTGRFDLPGTADEFGNTEASGSVTAVVPIPADAVRTYRLVLQTSDSDVPSISLNATLTALYVPFGPDADATAAYEYSCPRDDGYENNDAFGGSARILQLGRIAGAPLSAIACPADDDFYRINVNPGTTIDVSVLHSHALGDIDLYLLNSAGSVVAASESNDDDEVINFATAGGGLFYLRVHLNQDFGEAGAPYSLRGRLPLTPTSGSEPATEPVPEEVRP